MTHTEDWSSVTLYPHPQFVSKTALANKGGQALAGVTIQSLSKFTSVEEDRKLCPIRALRFYLDRLDKLRGDRKKLFISFKIGHKAEISLNTISSWLRQTIVTAYDSAAPDAILLFARGHDIRGLAASMAFVHSASVSDILSACTWKSHNTFTQFYLKDLTQLRGEMQVLGPIVAAQQVLGVRIILLSPLVICVIVFSYYSVL